MRRPARRLPTIAVAALALLAACGGPVLYVELVVPEVHVSLPQESIPAFTGVPVPGSECDGGESNCISQDLTYDFADAVPLAGEKHVEMDLRLTSMTMTLDGGVADLGGVQSVVLKVIDPADPTKYEIAASYVRTEPDPTSFTVSGNANIDLGKYLEGSVFTARAELYYDAPTPTFTVDIAATFSLMIKVDYGTYVGL